MAVAGKPTTMEFRSRKLAITDLETSGLDPRSHEILEIGLLIVDQRSLDVADALELKVKPEHIETASPSALALNGYKEADWIGAVSLKEALVAYASKVKDAVFCSHNVTFDWGFLCRGFGQTGVMHEMDYHRIDLFSVAWSLLGERGPREPTLEKIAAYLQIDGEPMPHRAMNGAWTAHRVLRMLLKCRKEGELKGGAEEGSDWP